uniref:Uncharacterized protein n=1 Tax=Oryza punctata TaxID=4537 RepID=A0A0E0MDJ8_ORYPU
MAEAVANELSTTPEYLRPPAATLGISADGGCRRNGDGEVSGSTMGHEAWGGAAVQECAAASRAASRDMRAEQCMIGDGC